MRWQDQLDAQEAAGIEAPVASPQSLHEPTLALIHDFPTIVGTSGNIYRAVNLVTEMTSAHKRYLRECIEPIHPLLIHTSKLLLGQVTNGADIEFSREDLVSAALGMNLQQGFAALMEDELDYRLVAALYLPENDRKFRAEDVEARIADLDELEYEIVFEAFKRFFTANWSCSQYTFLGFIRWILKRPQNARQ